MSSNNRVVCDLSKAQWCKFKYHNQHGNAVDLLPRHPTYRGMPIEGMRFGGRESLLDYATRTGLVDTWIPVCRVFFGSNKSLHYTGDKAKAIWKEWNRRIFKRKQ